MQEETALRIAAALESIAHSLAKANPPTRGVMIGQARGARLYELMQSVPREEAMQALGIKDLATWTKYAEKIGVDPEKVTKGGVDRIRAAMQETRANQAKRANQARKKASKKKTS